MEGLRTIGWLAWSRWKALPTAFPGNVLGAGQLIGVIARDGLGGGGYVEISRPKVHFHAIAPVLHGLRKWAYLTNYSVDLLTVCEYIDEAGLGFGARDFGAHAVESTSVEQRRSA